MIPVIAALFFFGALVCTQFKYGPVVEKAEEYQIISVSKNNAANLDAAIRVVHQTKYLTKEQESKYVDQLVEVVKNAPEKEAMTPILLILVDVEHDEKVAKEKQSWF